MIIARAPFRITLGGGGTDLPSFYEKHGGFVLSMALDKYIYVCLKPLAMTKEVRLQYSKTELFAIPRMFHSSSADWSCVLPSSSVARQ